MDKNGHLTVSLVFVCFILLSGIANNLLVPKEMVALLIGFIVFSTWLSPDIDLKLPFIAHRGPTHNPTGIMIVSVFGFIIAFGLKTFMNLNASFIYILVFMVGAAIAWMLHSMTDMMYDRIREISWLVILLPFILIFVR